MSVRSTPARRNRFFSWLGRFVEPSRKPFRRRLEVELLEDRITPAPIPTTTIAAPTAALIGQQAALTVSFDNTSAVPTDIGYGPYVDLYLPATGKDGNDGVSFVNATYLGLPVNATVLTLTAAGVNHPFARNSAGAPIKILPPSGFRAGDQLIVFELPFGSFTPTQPVVDLNVAVNVSNLADLNAALPLRSQGGFRFGADPLDNPTTDPTIIGASATQTVTPQLFTLRKQYVGPENETATGPNYVRQYQVIVDIANGQTVTNLDLTDVLPKNLQFVSVDSVVGNNTILVTPVATPSTTVPGGTLTRRLDFVTGTLGNSDAVMTFSFFAPLLTAPPALQEVLNLDTGVASTAIDDARASGKWDPIDTRDPIVTTTSDVTTNDHTLTLRSLATQKTAALVDDTGAAGFTPGDTVEYTLQVQVSDYFAFNNIVLTDILGDGLLLDSGFTPTLEVSEHGVATATPFTGVNFTVTPGTPDDTLTFRVSAQLIALGQDGILLGGNIPSGGTGAGNRPQSSPPLFSPGTTATVTFRAIIQDTYEQTQLSGTTTVSPNDSIPNSITIRGDLLDHENLVPFPGPVEVSDTSSAGVTILGQSAAKSVYAVNENPLIGSGPITINAGDRVTYRFLGTLPTTSANKFHLTDFLPVPLFVVSELDTLNLTVPGATPPPPGEAVLGPTDTFYARYLAIGGTGPTAVADDASNSATLDFGSFNDPDNTSTTFDILFTVTATSDPKTDQLFLTNQVVSQENNRQNVPSTDTSIVQVITSEPSLPEGSIQKGVVATNNPNGVFSPGVVAPLPFTAPGSPGPRFNGTLTTSSLLATPIDSNLSGVDAGDLVTFAIGVGNIGTGPNGAFDVKIRDTLPAGFKIPAGGLNMTVTDGTGAIMPFINLGTGTTSGLFGTGIQLTDPGPTSSPDGALDPGKDLTGNFIENGRNIAIITYDLEVVGTIKPNTTITNTASLFSFADIEGGPNFLTAPITNTAQVVTAVPTIAKRLVSTEIVNANNSNTQAVIGELVTYEVTLTVPEGQTPGVSFQDSLAPGMAFVRLGTVTRSSGVSFTATNQSVTNNGQFIKVDLGTITNNDRDNSRPDTITVTYTAVVLNVASNQNGTQLRNDARLTFTGGTPLVVSAGPVTVIEPAIDIAKSAQVGALGSVGEAGQTVKYTVTLQNNSNVDAFDLTFSDPLPRQTGGTLISNPVLVSVIDSAGLVTAAAFQIVGSEAAGYTLQTRPGVTFDFPVSPGRTITLVVTGTLPITVKPDQLIRNTATVRWTSLNGNPGTRSTFNANSTERTGSGTGPNDYLDSASADIRIGGELTKTLVSTSDSFTTGSDVAVGEIVRYRLQYRFPQGTASNFDFLDHLPAGMQYLNDGTTKVAFVSNGLGFAVDTGLFPPASLAFVTGNELTPVNPTFVLPASQITVAPGSGGDVTFSFGNVVNNDVDADAELIIVEFNALVLNEGANKANTTLSNDFIVRDNATQLGNPSQPVNVRVVEPKLTVDKQASPTTGDSGDRIDFVVTVTNASGATVSPAHDVRILDRLPFPAYLLDRTSITVTPVGTSTTFVNNSTLNTVDVTLATLPPGATAVIRYSAVLAVVVPFQVIDNTANLTYTSLPGPTGESPNPTGSVTPGASGAPNGERNGSGGVNTYFTSDSASVQVPNLALSKVVSGSSFTVTGDDQFDPTLTDLAIGEVVTFLVGFEIPEEVTTALLVDDLPIVPGKLEAISSRVVSIGKNIFGSNLHVGDAGIISDRSGDGINDRISFNFGLLANIPDNVVNAKDLIFVEVTARVPDVPENVNGLTLVNTATLTSLGGLLTDTASVEIVAPELNITKDIVSTTTINIGGEVDYEAHVRHTAASTEDALNVVITDLLADPSLTLVPNSVVVTSSTGSSVVELAPGSDGFQVTIPSIPLGDEVVIHYRATVSAPAQPGDILPNTIGVDYNGTPGDPAVRPRHDDATADLPVDGASVSGFVFHEERPGPDVAIQGTTVILIGLDIDSRPVLRSTTTDTNGFYEFLNLTPGTYTIVESQPAGFISSRQAPGTPFGQPSPVEDRLNLIIPAGSTLAGLDFDFWEVLPSSLAGFVYEDTANNGVRNLLDPGIPDVIVSLTGVDWNGKSVSRTLQTNTFGAYNFTDLLPGAYIITETQPAGYLDNPDTVGSLNGTKLGNDVLAIPNVGQGENGTDYNFGELLPSSISGYVYIDSNNNGRKDPGEVPISGVLVRLSGFDDLGDPVTAEFRTDSQGAFRFLGLRPGTYSLREVQPTAFLDGKDTVGNLGGTKSNDRFDDIILGVNEAAIDYLFGELSRPPSSKRDFLFSSPR